MGEMIRMTKEFEVGVDEMRTEESMRKIARTKISEWTRELWKEGYTKIEQGVDLEITTPVDHDPRYVIFSATLTASKE